MEPFNNADGGGDVSTQTAPPGDVTLYPLHEGLRSVFQPQLILWRVSLVLGDGIVQPPP